MARTDYPWPAGQSKDTIEVRINGSWKKFHFQQVAQRFETLASDNSGRTEDGVMRITYIRPLLVKLECKLPPITNAELSNWSSFFSNTYGKNAIAVRYFDISKNKGQAITCYCSNFQGDVYSGVLYNGMWHNISINLIEV